MDPKPDHGETSYKGSGRLRGRKALVTGGDSGIGRAAAIAFAREGADVAVNYRPVEEPDAREVIALIKAAGRKAVALPGDIRDEAFCMGMTEETEVDAKSARIVNANIAEYLVPAHADVPPIDIIFVDEQDPHVNPLGVKGIGELPMVGAAAAIANAVFHATGIRVRDYTTRIEKLLKA